METHHPAAGWSCGLVFAQRLAAVSCSPNRNAAMGCPRISSPGACVVSSPHTDYSSREFLFPAGAVEQDIFCAVRMFDSDVRRVLPTLTAGFLIEPCRIASDAQRDFTVMQPVVNPSPA